MQPSETTTKAFRISPEVAQKFSSLRRDNDRNENEVFSRVVSQAVQLSKRKDHSDPMSIGAGELTLEACQELLREIEVSLNESSTVEARKSLQENARSFSDAAQNHKAWFKVLESNLDKSYDSINRALVGCRELLPEVRKCSSEIEILQNHLREKHCFEYQNIHEKTVSELKNVYLKIVNLCDRYDESLETISSLPNVVNSASIRLKSELDEHKDMLDQATNERMKSLSEGAISEVENLKNKIKKGHRKQLWIVAIPSAVVLLGMIFLGLFQPAFEKIQYDKIVSEVLNEKISEVGNESLERQKSFLESIQKRSEESIQSLFRSYDKTIEQAVKDAHKVAFAKVNESGKVKAFSEEVHAKLVSEQRKVSVLEAEKANLQRQLGEEWGFWDSVFASPFLFFFSSVFLLFAGYLGARIVSR